jgi:predicted metal-binding protein
MCCVGSKLGRRIPTGYSSRLSLIFNYAVQTHIFMIEAVFRTDTDIAVATEIIICTTCRPAASSRDVPAAGEVLLEAVQVASWELDGAQKVRVRGQACLSSCERACTVAFQAPGKYTYFFGDLAADGTTATQLLACAQLHADSTDGNLLRKDRPERLRKGILARLPPFATIAIANF